MKTRITSLFLTLAMFFSLAVPALAEDLPATEEVSSAEPVYVPVSETPAYEDLPPVEDPAQREPAEELLYSAEHAQSESEGESVTSSTPVEDDSFQEAEGLETSSADSVQLTQEEELTALVTEFPYEETAAEAPFPTEHPVNEEDITSEETAVSIAAEKISEEVAAFFADGVIASGTCGANGDNITWAIDSDRVLTFSGNGAMVDYGAPVYKTNSNGDQYVMTCAPWGDYGFSFDKVVFSSGITKIGENAFLFCTTIKSIIIPASVTEIGREAFNECVMLETIQFGHKNGDPLTFAANYSVFHQDLQDTKETVIYVPDTKNINSAIVNYGWGTDYRSVEYKDIGSESDGLLIDKNHFPDSNFRSFISSNYDADSDGKLSPDEIFAVQSMVCSDQEILSLEGILYFTNLGYLDCSNNILTSLDVSKLDSLSLLYCSNNQLTNLKINGNIIFLNCESNCLTELDTSNCTKLKELSCSSNKIAALNLISCKNTLRFLSCEYNLLADLDLNEHTNLEQMGCNNNQLADLNVSGCSNLTYINCSSNQLKTLDVRSCPNLGTLICRDNQLSELKISGLSSLYYFYCNNNHLSKLDINGCSIMIELVRTGTKTDENGITSYSDNTYKTFFVDSSVEIICASSGDIGRCPLTYGDHTTWFDHDLTYYVSHADSTSYNWDLASMLVVLAAAAYDQKNIESSLRNMAFDLREEDIHNYDDNFTSVGYSISRKTADDGSVIVAVIIRGTPFSLNAEWLSDFTIAVTPGHHPGFRIASNEIVGSLFEYISSIEDRDKIRFVITGHSRGAAVGNLVAYQLINNGFSAGQIFDYNFACPDTVLGDKSTWNPGGKYNCIFNISNICDMVGAVPGFLGTALSSMNIMNMTPLGISDASSLIWGKYGQTYYFSRDWSSYSESHVRPLDVLEYHSSETYVDLLTISHGQFSNFKTPEQARANAANLISPAVKTEIGKWIGVCCPVDVLVRDASGNLIASVINGAPNCYGSSFPDVMILVNGDDKFIYLSNEISATIELTGTASGEMLYFVSSIDECYEEAAAKDFASVALEPGKEMLSPISAGQDVETVPLYVLNDAGEKILEVETDGTEIPYEEPMQLFPDVSDTSRYYYEPVYWALQNNITKGYGQDSSGRDLFSPDAPCTREQIVTFLWRLMKEPEPLNYDRSFTDVSPDKWYYKPIMWAASTGITTGYADGSGRFGIGDPCTREQCVTFLWRAAGKPAPASYSAFTDVPAGSYYYDSVSWAASNNITVGLNDGTGRFGVGMTCSRAMIVTFLYRYNNVK